MVTFPTKTLFPLISNNFQDYTLTVQLLFKFIYVYEYLSGRNDGVYVYSVESILINIALIKSIAMISNKSV